MKLEMFYKLFLLIGLFSGAIQISAQLPPIFADTTKTLFQAKTIAEFPVNTFLENIAIDKEGNLFVTSLEEGKIYRVTPSGEKMKFAEINGKIAGLTFDKKDNLIATGWADGTTPSLFRIDKNGKVEVLIAIEGAVFLNGITCLKDDKFLIADSYKGVIWEFDAETNKYSVWLEDEKLARSNDQNPFPGVNGLKIYKGNLYATNTERQQILQIPIKKGQAGSPKTFAFKINGDDFAIDEKGNLYITTHVYNSVVKVTKSGKLSIIGESQNGLTGSTALAFGRDKSNRRNIFVITNGGMSFPPIEGIQKAKIVRLEVGEKSN